ncbi:MAG TPA: hypothetical protein VHC49_15525 [Mycobacteriales bacterium]|nr:hypothetical protein [Mycobacteriales bacterium]
MRRLFWLALGGVAGALLVRKLTQTAERFSPSGITQSLSESAGRMMDSVRDFVDDARSSAAEREAELKESTGLDGKLDAKPEDFQKR